MSRTVRARYVDPLDAIWLSVARGFGLEVRRSSDVYASTDGSGVLTLGTPETLDADDCVAQMIFHELCHACVQGPRNHAVPDWGLDNETEIDVVRERACLRLQAALAGPHGLRVVFGPTTDYRTFYDALPADPFEGEGDDVLLAREAFARAAKPPYADAFDQALRASADVFASVARVEAAFGPSDELALHRASSRTAAVQGDAGAAAASAVPPSSTTGAAETPNRVRT